MRGLKRLFYYVLLNIVISVVTTLLVLNWWENRHPALPETTPADIVVTPTPASVLPVVVNASPATPTAPLTATLQATPIQPSPTLELIEYEVRAGDTLGDIAARFGVSVADIMLVNGLDNPDVLSVGQILYIPTSALPATATTIPPTLVVSPTPRPSPTPTGPTPTPTATLTGHEPQVVIDVVVGAGDLDREYVRLRRTGDGELPMEGWRLEDEDGNIYTFPRFTMFAGGAVNIYTRAGQNTYAELYWGLTAPVWNHCETISLYDATNTLRATYRVP